MVSDLKINQFTHVTHEQPSRGVSETASFKMPSETVIKKELAAPKPLTPAKKEKALAILARISKFAVGVPVTATLFVILIPWACVFSVAVPIGLVVGPKMDGAIRGLFICIAPYMAILRVVEWMDEKNKA